jgi:hypothetical protein
MRYLLVLMIVLFNLTFASAQEIDSTYVPQKPSWINDSIPREKLLVAKINNNSNDQAVTDYKIEAALSLACLVSNKYQLIPFSAVDSVAQSLKERNIKTTAKVMADSLHAQKLVFLTVNQLENMLRIDLSAIDSDDPDLPINGYGYAAMHYINAEDNKPVLDPAVLKSIQRALIMLSGNDSLYAQAEGTFKVYKAAPLVIGGIQFKDDREAQIPWSLFAKQVIYSYDAVETIFGAISRSPNYAVYDIASRDSMYAKFGMYTVENYQPVSIHEIDVLNKFEVKYYIGGSFERTSSGAKINLYLADVLPQNKLKVIKEYFGTIESDDILEFRAEIERIAQLLVEQNPKND